MLMLLARVTAAPACRDAGEGQKDGTVVACIPGRLKNKEDPSHRDAKGGRRPGGKDSPRECEDPLAVMEGDHGGVP
jgi:hypothetical protein